MNLHWDLMVREKKSEFPNIFILSALEIPTSVTLCSTVQLNSMDLWSRLSLAFLAWAFTHQWCCSGGKNVWKQYGPFPNIFSFPRPYKSQAGRGHLCGLPILSASVHDFHASNFFAPGGQSSYSILNTGSPWWTIFKASILFFLSNPNWPFGLQCFWCKYAAVL